MSSTPVSGSVAGDDSQSTPPSSPPSSTMSDKDYDPVSGRMLEEEKRMKEEAKREREEGKKRTQDWHDADDTEQKGQFKKLLHLVEKSKVRRETPLVLMIISL